MKSFCFLGAWKSVISWKQFIAKEVLFCKIAIWNHLRNSIYLTWKQFFAFHEFVRVFLNQKKLYAKNVISNRSRNSVYLNCKHFSAELHFLTFCEFVQVFFRQKKETLRKNAYLNRLQKCNYEPFAKLTNFFGIKTLFCKTAFSDHSRDRRKFFELTTVFCETAFSNCSQIRLRFFELKTALCKTKYSDRSRIGGDENERRKKQLSTSQGYDLN